MKSVLFLSYYFPPIGGAGAQRPAAFARHLPQLGWAPVVITGPGPTPNRWTPRDDSLVARLPDEVEVRRVPGPEPPADYGVRNRLGRYLALQNRWSRWWVEGAVASAAELERGIDLVYAWMSPFNSAAAASRIAEALGRPWVADLGDPWALDEMMVYPSRLHRRRAVREMREGLATAGAIVMSTPEAARRVRAAFPEFRDKQILVIPNGFDAADFAGPVPARADAAFRMVHTGYFHTELGLRQRRRAWWRQLVGGIAKDVDFLTRSHVYLLQAVDRLRQRDPSLAETIEVHFAGVLSAADREIAEASGDCRLHGYLAHDEALELVRSADLLFLPMQDLPPGVRATIVPGKTYEYLASGRPILAAVPDGDARDLLAAAGSALLCRPADVEAMTQALARQLERFHRGVPAPDPNREVVGRYEYGRLVHALADVFDTVAAGARRSTRARAGSGAEAVGAMAPSR